jgi:hypothetical protein
LHFNLGHFVVFFCLFVLCCFVWFGLVFFPIWWDNYRNYFWDNTSRIGGWGTNTKSIKTETLLHLTWRSLFFYFLFNLFYYFFHFFSNPLSVSLMPVQLTID